MFLQDVMEVFLISLEESMQRIMVLCWNLKIHTEGKTRVVAAPLPVQNATIPLNMSMLVVTTVRKYSILEKNLFLL